MVGIVVNRVAGRGRAFRRYKKELHPALVKHAVDFIEVMEDGVENMQNRIKRLIKEGVRLFVVVGGDGTLNRVVETIKGSGVRIIPFPAGTGNDFMKSLGKENMSVSRVLECIRGKCKTKFLDIGYVDTELQSHIFINGLGHRV